MADTEYDVTVSVNESVNADVGSTQIEGGLSIDETLLSLSAESPDDIIVDANVNTTEALEVTAEENTGGTDDHRKLLHRDAQDQHPIYAITNLQTLLNSIGATLVTHGTDITTATTSAGNAMNVATQAADDLDVIIPIVGANQEAIVDVRETAIESYTELNERATNIANGSLVLNGFASFNESNGSVSLYTASNKVNLTGNAMVFSRNAVAVAYIQTDNSYGSYLKVTDSIMSYLYMRSPSGSGNLTWIANNDGHLSLKRV